ncbi:MAG: hypothetical protein ACWA5Q_11465 [bacterium]
MNMQRLMIVGLCALMVPLTGIAREDQAKLDAACEAAREKKLAPLRRQRVSDCIKNKEMDKKGCESAYSNWNGRTGNQQLPFYDLPECDKAFKNRKGTER